MDRSVLPQQFVEQVVCVARSERPRAVAAAKAIWGSQRREGGELEEQVRRGRSCWWDIGVVKEERRRPGIGAVDGEERRRRMLTPDTGEAEEEERRRDIGVTEQERGFGRRSCSSARSTFFL